MPSQARQPIHSSVSRVESLPRDCHASAFSIDRFCFPISRFCQTDRHIALGNSRVESKRTGFPVDYVVSQISLTSGETLIYEPS